MAPPLIDTFIVPEVPDVLYALFDYGLTIQLIMEQVEIRLHPTYIKNLKKFLIQT